MNTESLYPASPINVPESLTTAKQSYRRQTMLAFGGLLAFVFIYLCLTASFAFITYSNITSLSEAGDGGLLKIIIIFCAGLLTLFMLKSLFAVRKMPDPSGIEVFAQDQPEFCLLYTSPSPRDRTRSRMPSSA